MTSPLDEKLDIVRNIMRGKMVLVAFSGGVDSTALASLAKEVADSVLLLTMNSPMVPSIEKGAAKRVSEELQLKHEVIEVDWLVNEELVENPKNRCYLCKKQLAKIWQEVANRNNLEIVVEGTNTSEIEGYRPGTAALKEIGIRSPFLEASLTKSEIRDYLREKGISVADSPSMACMATRFPYDTRITKEKLDMVERMECMIMEIFDIRTVRARLHGDIVRIEIGKDEREKFFDMKKLDEIHSFGTSIGFTHITFDTKGYRTGSMDE